MSTIIFAGGAIKGPTNPSGGSIALVTITNNGFIEPLTFAWTSTTGGTAITDTTLNAKTGLAAATYTLTVRDASATPQTATNTYVMPAYVLAVTVLDGTYPKFVSYDPGYRVTSTGITIEGWCFPTQTPSNTRWFELGLAFGNTANMIECYFTSNTTTLNMSNAGTIICPFSQWTHVAITCTQAGNLVTYKNGVQVSTGNNGLSTALYAVAWWGKSIYNGDTGASFYGRMAEMRIWSTVRSAAQILAAYKTSFVLPPDASLICNVSSAAVGATSTGIISQPFNQTATLQGYTASSVAVDTTLNGLVSTANFMSAASVTDNTVLNGVTGAIGAISVGFTGAVSPISYLWSTNSTTPITDALISAHTGLAAGLYTLVARDSSATPVTLTASFTVGEPLSFTFAVVNSSGANGSVAITSLGKTNFMWSTGAVTSSITNLGPGTYSCILSSGTFTATISAFVQSSNAIALTVLRCNGNLLDTGSLKSILNDAPFLLNGAPTYTTGPYAGLQALVIPKKGVLSLPYNTSLDFSAAASWSFGGWYNMSSFGPSNFAYVGYNSRGTSGAGYNFIVSSTSQFYAQRTAATEQTSTAANSSTLLNTWVHLWVTYSASNALMTTYINGVAKNSSTSTSTLQSGARWQIGSAVLNQANAMACAVADLRWFSGVVDPLQAMQNYGPVLFTGGAVTDATTNGGSDGSIAAVSFTLSTAVAPIVFSWSYSVGATIISDTTLAAKTGLAAGEYTLTGTDSLNVKTIQVFTVGAPLLLTSTSTPANLSTNGTAAVLNAGSGLCTYQWSNGSTASSISSLVIGTYTCAVTCGTFKANISVIVAGAPLFIWSPAINFNGSAIFGLKALSVLSQSVTVTPLIYTSSFTIECYAFATSQGFVSNLINIEQTSTNRVFQNNNTLFCVKNGVQTSVVAGSNMTWFANHHIAISYDAALGRLYYAVNGIVASLLIGAMPVVNGTPIKFIMNNSGNMDDLRISSACLYTSNFTPPNLTASLSNVGSTIYYENFEGLTSAVPKLQLSLGSATDNTVINGASGSISSSAFISAGSAPLTIVWSSSVGASVITSTDLSRKSNLKAGNYTVTVVDNIGQIANFTWSIGEPIGTITATGYPSFDGFNGSATCSITGTAVPNCIWSNASQGTSTLDLRRGNYSVIVYSGNYSGTANVVVTGFDPVVLQPTWGSNPILTIDNKNTGLQSLDLRLFQNSVTIPSLNLTQGWTVEAFVNVSSGAGSTLSFVGPSNLNSVFINNGKTLNVLRSGVSPASQFVTSTGILNALVWTHMAFSVDPVNSRCYISINGKTDSMLIDSTLADARTPLSLFNGATKSFGFLDSLKATQAVLYPSSTYTVPNDALWLATDANVVFYENFDYTIIPGLTTDAPGTIAATIVTGGTAPLTFNWTSTGTAVSSITAGALSGLSAGTYVLNIKDALNVRRSYTYIIYNPMSITFSTTASTDGSNGSVIANVTGGGPKSFSWSSGGVAFSTTPNLYNVAAGTYVCTVTTPASSVTSTTVVTGLATPVAWTRGPRSLTTFNIAYTGTSCLDLTQTAFGYYPSVNVAGFSFLKSFTIEGFVNAQTYSPLFSANSTSGIDGTYFFQTNNLAQFFNNGTINASTPSVPTGQWIHIAFGWDATVNKVYSSVNGFSVQSQFSAGSMAAIADTRPINLLWRDTGTTVACNGYLDSLRISQSVIYTSPTYTIPDPNLWSSGGSVLYYEDFEPIKLFALVTNASTFGGNTGSVTSINVSSGVPPYVVTWSGGLSNNLSAKNGLSAGKYTLIVTDAVNASTNKTFTVLQPLSVASTSKKITVGNNGSASASALGGNGIYSFLWSNGQKTAFISGLSPGTYTCTIRSDIYSASTSVIIASNTAGTAYWSLDINKYRSTARALNGVFSLDFFNILPVKSNYPRLMIPGLDFSSDFTIEMYVYPTLAATVMAIFNDASTLNQSSSLIRHNAFFSEFTASAVERQGTLNAIPLNVFSHISFTYQASTTSYNFGVGGVNQLFTGRQSFSIFNGVRPIDILFRSDSGNTSKGFIDCIRVTQSALYTTTSYSVPTPAAMASSSSLYFENFESYIH